jgi:hypothetical protein
MADDKIPSQDVDQFLHTDNERRGSVQHVDLNKNLEGK